MIPSFSAPVGAQPQIAQNAPKPNLQPQAEAPRTSMGEISADTNRSATPQAIDAAEQSSVSPRHRDQEKSENAARALGEPDPPTGPPPSFEESFLTRQAREALDPPETPTTQDDLPELAPENEPEVVDATKASPADSTKRAESSFTETRELSEPTVPSQINITV